MLSCFILTDYSSSELIKVFGTLYYGPPVGFVRFIYSKYRTTLNFCNKMRLFRSVKIRLLTFILCVSLLPITIITTLYYLSARSALKNQIIEELRVVTGSRRLRILSFMETKQTRTLDFSSDGLIRESLKQIYSAASPGKDVVVQLNKHLIKNKIPLDCNLLSIILVDKHGKIVSSTHERLIGDDLSNQDIFIRGLKKGYGEVYVGVSQWSHYINTNCISVSAPIISQQSPQVLGVIINVYNLAFLSEITTKRIGMGKSGEIYLVNGDKVMLTESKYVENAPLKQVVNTKPTRKFIKSDKEMVGIYKNHRGVSVIGVSSYIPEYGWMLISEIDESEAFAPLGVLGTIAWVLGLVSVIVITIAVTIFVSLILKPVKDLAHAMRGFASGKLDYRVRVTRKDEIGNLASCFNIMAEELQKEIVAHKSVEEALRIGESKYRLLLENLPQRIFYKDKNLIYVSCNENLARDLHLKPHEINGKTDYDFYPKELADKCIANDKRVMESGQMEDTEEKFICNGQEFIMHIVRTPIKDEKGNVIGILGMFWDVTEKVALRLETMRNRHLIALGELAEGVGHEINNPINGIINCAQILFNKSKEGSNEKDIAHRIIKEGDRVAEIVHSLLTIAKPEDKKETKIPINIYKIFSDTLILKDAQLRNEGIQVKVDIPQDLPKISVYPRQMQQVVLNLISNGQYALNQKYPETHDNKILEIMAEKITIDKYPYIRIIFYDHGIGIPAHIINKVLDPFFTTKTRHKGAGLGLSISNSIVCGHGGKILVDSIEGEFAKVSVILPVVQAGLKISEI